MIHRLFTVAPVLSTVLFALTVLLWTDSFRRDYDAVYLPDRPRSFELYCVRGAIVSSVIDTRFADDPSAGTLRLRCQITDLQPSDLGYFADLGFATGRIGELWFHSVRYSTPPSYNLPPTTERMVVIPAWLPAFAFIMLPAAKLRRHCLRRRRRVAGRCPACGYDLRASADRCPECGTPIPSSGRTTA